MPNYTLIVEDSNGNRLRQFSGTRREVEEEFDSLSHVKWNGCIAYWCTRKGKGRGFKRFSSLSRKKKRER